MDDVRFYRIKDELRILGLDDAPFKPKCDKETMLIGAIFRGGSFIDGILRTEVEVDGIDSTEKIIDMVEKTHHKDLRVIMLDGLGFAGFNLVDIERLYEKTHLPVIAIMRKMPDFDAIDSALENLRHRKYYRECIRKAGTPVEIEVCIGKKIYMQYKGLSQDDARRIVKLSTTRSLIPEPLRVAHLIASGVALGESRGRA